MTNEPTKEELEQRVEELESAVSKMLPNRRQTLAGGAALLTGGLLGAGGASASTGSAGDVGTQSDPADVFADAVDANSVSTAETAIGNHPSVTGVESGIVSFDDPGAPSDDTWGTNTQDTQSVSFSTSFSSTSNLSVVLASNNPLSFRGIVSYLNLTTSGMDVVFRKYSTLPHAGSEEARYLVVEQS